MIKKDYVFKLRELFSSVNKKVELVAANKREIFIFGAGNTSNLHAKCFATEGINPVGFLDNDPEKQGTALLTGGGTGIFP